MALEHTFEWRDGTRTERLTPARAIRMKCFDCMGWEVGVERLIRECEITYCALWPFRLGKNPSKQGRPVSPEKREEARKRMAELRKKGRLCKKSL